MSHPHNQNLDVARGLDHLLTDVPAEVIVLHSPAGIIHYASNLAQQVFSTSAKLIGTSLIDRIHEADRERARHVFTDTASRSSQATPMTIRLVGDDERTVWAVLFTVAVKDATGRVIELHSTLRDVTHQIQLRDRIVERDTLAHTTNTLAKVGGWYHDLTTEQTYWTDEVRQIHEVDETFVPNTESIRRFFSAEDMDRMLATMDEAMSLGQPSVLETRMVVNANRQKWIRVFFSVEHLDGKPTRLYGATQDITEIKEREEALERLVRELAHQRDRLEEFNHLVSHQLRAPLTSLVSVFGLLRETDEAAERARLESTMFDAIQSLERTIDEVGDAVRIRNEIAPRKEKIYIRDVVLSVRTQLATSLRDAQATIEIDTESAPIIEYPLLYLETILRHLMNNALRFSDPERTPKIKVSTHVNSEGRVEMVISDNGVGIDLQRNGDRLFKLGNTFHRNASGRGTGLFMVKTMVESLGGSVSVESVPETGTTFHIVLSESPLEGSHE